MIRVGKGKSAITLDGPIGAGLEKEIRAILGPVADKMQAEADAVLEAALKEWPIKSGDSAKAWDTVLTVIPNTFQVEISILNPVGYVRYIKSTKEGKEDDAVRLRSPLQTLVVKPSRAVTKRLKKELPPIIAAALNSKLMS